MKNAPAKSETCSRSLRTKHDALRILSTRRAPYTFGFPDIRSLHKGTAEDVMTRRVIKCSAEGTIEDALDKMMHHGIRRLPVTKKGDIVGEICLRFILERFSEIAKKKVE